MLMILDTFCSRQVRKFHGKYDVGTVVNAILGALVAITAPCAAVTPGESILIGAVGALLANKSNDWLVARCARARRARARASRRAAFSTRRRFPRARAR